MSLQLRIVIFVSLLSACGDSPGPATTQVAPPNRSTAPPVQPIEPPKPEAPAAAPRQVECRGGEVVATWQSAAGDDATSKTAKLSFAAAGHRAWTYDFEYESDVLASARHRISSWSFAGGDVNDPNTHDKVIERHYELAGGKLVTCSERRAEGAGDEIEQLVRDAPAKKIPCEQGAAVISLGRHAAQPITSADTTWLKAACESDESSGLKL
jgi:hypothetical protein